LPLRNEMSDEITDQPDQPTPKRTGRKVRAVAPRKAHAAPDVASARAEVEDLKAQIARQQEQLEAQNAQNALILDRLIDQEAVVAEAVAQAQQVGEPKGTKIERALNEELEELKAEFADYPAIEVFERRALLGMPANLEIRLKDEPLDEARKWYLRWFNFGKEGRADEFRAKAYVKVRWDELRDYEGVATANRMDEFVRKGERGQEVLGKMPLKLYEYQKRREALVGQSMLRSESQLKSHLANQVSRGVGKQGGNADQAGSFVHGQTFVTIKPGPKETFTA
jgi:hypothetical protein